MKLTILFLKTNECSFNVYLKVECVQFYERGQVSQPSGQCASNKLKKLGTEALVFDSEWLKEVVVYIFLGFFLTQEKKKKLKYFFKFLHTFPRQYNKN